MISDKQICTLSRAATTILFGIAQDKHLLALKACQKAEICAVHAHNMTVICSSSMVPVISFFQFFICISVAVAKSFYLCMHGRFKIVFEYIINKPKNEYIDINSNMSTL